MKAIKFSIGINKLNNNRLNFNKLYKCVTYILY